jgi:hypothetical protein
MPKMSVTYDTECWKLAKHFLGDLKGCTDIDVHELAYDIQQLCQNACTAVEERMKRIA